MHKKHKKPLTCNTFTRTVTAYKIESNQTENEMRSNTELVARPAKTRLQTSEICGPKFRKFLLAVEG